MKKIIQHYSADLDWIHSMADEFEGKVEGNFIKVSETIHSGTRYFLDCGDGIVALYVDATYNTDLQLIQQNIKDDFIGLYFNLSESEAKLSFDTESNMMGSWSYNLSLIDSSLKFQFDVKKGSNIFVFCIFIKKDTIRKYAAKNNILKKSIDKIMNPKLNTIIKWERMSIKSYHELKELQRLKVGDVLFDLNMIGTVHILISDYLEKVSKDTCIIQLVNESDLASILSVQRYLLENINDHFPTIKTLSQKSNMSISKFKSLFKKITGDTPNSFFMNNKLVKAKELLEERQLSITEISNLLNFGHTAYFAYKFKKKFGLLPKTYSQQL